MAYLVIAIIFTWYGLSTLTVTVSPALWFNIAKANLQALDIFPDSGSASAGPTIKYSSSTSSSRIFIFTVQPRVTTFDDLSVDIISAWVNKLFK